MIGRTRSRENRISRAIRGPRSGPYLPPISSERLWAPSIEWVPVMGSTGTVAGRLRDETVQWLERVFFGGAELSLLSSPAFVAVLILQTRYPDAVPIAGLLAIGLGSVSIALFRAKALDVGAWPRRGELATLPYGSATSAPSFCLRPSGSRWQRRRPGRCGSPCSAASSNLSGSRRSPASTAPSTVNRSSTPRPPSYERRPVDVRCAARLGRGARRS